VVGNDLVVYQAYSDAIAEPALRAGRFRPPFSRSRMTWIKPSFLWAAYRSGWAGKPGQERLLAITMPRECFVGALRKAAREQWRGHCAASPVRVQWDAERDLHLQPLPYRSLQVGLGPPVVDSYVDEWILGIDDVTPTAHRIERLLAQGLVAEAATLLPHERHLPLPADVRAAFGATA